MPSKHKTLLVGWHPSDPETGPWLRAEAKRRDVPIARVLDEAVRLYRDLSEGDGQMIRDVWAALAREAATEAEMESAAAFRIVP